MVQQKVYSALSELLPSESTAQPAENDAVDTFDGVQYGIGSLHGSPYCFLCNNTVAKGRSAQIDHVLSTKHDELAKRKGTHARAPGWHLRDLRSVVREPVVRSAKNSLTAADRKRKAEESITAQHEERRKRRKEFHDPLNTAKPPVTAPKDPTLDASSARENISQSFLAHWLAAGIPIHTTDRMLPWLRQHCIEGGFITKSDNLRKSVAPGVAEVSA